ncbi:hypothetical protein Mp_4g08200 [Marchantia polymorpha subsp. ruderalis]|uniref:Uncharacterized protein n=2 Tax=Marchantia polymorpha TaxID=3197 RepID=A0AAF6B7N8_MARPO|nr:hypothetical protein MARPO_0120s0026 [Marchantia polymorpha]BBN08022.1 hypothetical protein Mp_4g08200 [Marchantia polymorpha subsp. ruderalis]|eukprot:PTQ30750.1 hypothetical protein MARPO_0120s0026 [Marchantia polymorpha]
MTRTNREMVQNFLDILGGDLRGGLEDSAILDSQGFVFLVWKYTTFLASNAKGQNNNLSKHCHVEQRIKLRKRLYGRM